MTLTRLVEGQLVSIIDDAVDGIDGFTSNTAGDDVCDVSAMMVMIIMMERRKTVVMMMGQRQTQ